MFTHEEVKGKKKKKRAGTQLGLDDATDFSEYLLDADKSVCALSNHTKKEI